MHCYPRMLTACEIYLHKFVHEEVFLRKLYDNYRLVPRETVNFVSLELRLSGNKIKTESIIIYY